MFYISNSALESKLKEMLSLSHQFMTSAEVVMNASGLRIEAIRAIAREQGVEIDDERSRCIDENLLSHLADAHVRRMKFYFKNSKRHIAELSGAELATYVDFCKTFKKHQSDSSIAQDWDDIDTDALREQFIRKVHFETPNPLEELFGGVQLKVRPMLSPSEALDAFTSKDKTAHRGFVIDQTLKSRWCYVRPRKTKPVFNDRRQKARCATLSARYHIYSADDKDNISHGIYCTIVNNKRTLRGVA